MYNNIICPIFVYFHAVYTEFSRACRTQAKTRRRASAVSASQNLGRASSLANFRSYFKLSPFSLLARTHGNTCFLATVASTKNTVQPQGYTVFLVEATGIEPTTSASRTLRATSCATPRYLYAPLLKKRIYYSK